jgi:hypothetical protein
MARHQIFVQRCAIAAQRHFEYNSRDSNPLFSEGISRWMGMETLTT